MSFCGSCTRFVFPYATEISVNSKTASLDFEQFKVLAIEMISSGSPGPILLHQLIDDDIDCYET